MIKTCRLSNPICTSMSLRQFRIFSSVFIALGFSWLILNWWVGIDVTPCFLKNLTGIACPGCGSTRAALLALVFQFNNAVSLNPLGLIYAIALIVLPIWILYDLFSRSETMFKAWNVFERICKRNSFRLFLILFIGYIWIHNILIGL